MNPRSLDREALMESSDGFERLYLAIGTIFGKGLGPTVPAFTQPECGLRVFWVIATYIDEMSNHVHGLLDGRRLMIIAVPNNAIQVRSKSFSSVRVVINWSLLPAPDCNPLPYLVRVLYSSTGCTV